jgi:carboxymethylenebutenolidase
MYEDSSPIGSLVHLYFDGAFSRRELVRRVAGYTGSIAAAAAVLTSMGVAEAQQLACPDDVRVPEDAPDLVMQDVQYPGDAGPIFAYIAQPRTDDPSPIPAVVVIQQNRGLVDYIKDVTRRVARAGYVGLGVDLLSRQGGTQQFTDPVAQMQAYSRTTQPERRADLISSLAYLKTLSSVQANALGAVGFCAGGGNCWDLAVNSRDVSAAVVFYGAPPSPIEMLDNLAGPVLGNYAELDRTLTGQTPAIISGLLSRQKTFGLHIYQGANHAFHDDTGPAYNPAAACEAWAKTIAWFDKFLKSKSAPA